MYRRLLYQLFNVKTVFFCILISYLLCFTAKTVVNQKTVYGDGRYYYAWLHSLGIDHDSNFTNEYDRYGITEPNTAYGLPRNVYAIGPALFWMQPFNMVHALFQNDGYTFPYQFAVGVFDVLAVVAGLGILYRLIHRYFDRSISLFTILGIAFATNLFFYGSLDTVNSHSLSFLFATIILHLFLTQKKPLLLGCFIGILALIRSQDALFLVLLLPALSLVPIVQGVGGFLAGFAPQLIAWQFLYGTFTKSPYLDSDHSFALLQPHLFDVLFSSNNGLFLWTPILLFATIGLCLPLPVTKIQRVTLLLLVLLQWYVVSSWSFWWQGESFSGRMFISVLPVFAFGLAGFLKKLSTQQRISVIAITSVVNLVTITTYLLTH